MSSVAALRRTLLNAKSAAYPGEGASGIYFIGENETGAARGEADLVVTVFHRAGRSPGPQGNRPFVE
jgi:hypothetical protein